MPEAALGQLTPEFVEMKLGNDTAPKLEELHGGRLQDPRLEGYLNEVGQKLLVHSTRKDYPHAFIPLASPNIVNAFAIGNGNTYVTRALLDLLDDEAELAFVMGHEMGHVDKRHIASSLDRAVGLTLLLDLAESAAGEKAAGETMALAKGVVGGLVLNGFGREAELEADEKGLKYAVEAGYDPMASVRVFQKLQKLAPDVKGIEVYLQSHPNASKRITEAEKEIKDRFPNKTGVTNKERFQEFVKGALVDHDESQRTADGMMLLVITGSLLLVGAGALWLALTADSAPAKLASCPEEG